MEDVPEDDEGTPKRSWAKAAGFGAIGLVAVGSAAFWGLSDDRTKRAVFGWAMAPQITGPEPESASEPLPLLKPGELAYRPAAPDASGVPAAMRESPELMERASVPIPRPRLPTFAAIEIASSPPPPMLGGGRVAAERNASVPDGLGTLTPPLILAASLAVPPDLLDGARTLPAFEIEPEPEDPPEAVEPPVEAEGTGTDSGETAGTEGDEATGPDATNGQTIDEGAAIPSDEGQTSEAGETAAGSDSAEPRTPETETAAAETPTTETSAAETATPEPQGESLPAQGTGAEQTGTDANGAEATETAAVSEQPRLPDPALKLYLLTAPPGLNCLALSFNNAAPVAKGQPLTGALTEIEIGGDVCGAELRLETTAADPRALVVSHRFVAGNPPALDIVQNSGTPDRLVISLKPRARLRGPAALEIEARWSDSRGALPSGSQNVSFILRPGLGGF